MNTLTLVFSIVFVIFIVVGIWSAKNIKNTLDFYVMGRQAPALLIIGTTTASVLSAVFYFGAAAIWYKEGPLVSSQFGAWLGTWTGLMLGMLYFCRRFRAANAYTIPDYIGERYSSQAVRGIFTLILIVALMGYAVAQLQGSALMLTTFTGISYGTYIVLTAIALFIFCSLGGQWGVIVTDTIMATCIIIMNIFILPRFVFQAGGLKAISALLATKEPAYWTIGGTLGKPVNLAFATFMIWVFYAAISPFFSARGFSAKSDLTLLKSVTWSTFLYIAIPFLTIVTIIPAIHLLNPNITPPEACIITMLNTNVHPVLGGFAAGALMGAVFSTADSVLIYIGFALSRDIYQQMINPKAPEKQQLMIARIAQALAIIIAAWVAYSSPEGLWWVVTNANGLLVSGWVPTLILGCEWKKATKEGAIASMIIGSVAYLTAATLKTSVHPIFIGIITGFLAHLIVSFITKPGMKEITFFEKMKSNALSAGDIKQFMETKEGRNFLLQEYKSLRLNMNIVLVIAILFFGFLFFAVAARIPAI